MTLRLRTSFPVVFAVIASCVLVASCGSGGDSTTDPIAQVMDKPRYTSAKSQWSLVVMDASTAEVLQSLQPDKLVLTASVRKLYSVATALNVIGADHRFVTPVYRNGTVDSSGKLMGDLILKASGDLTLADGRRPMAPSTTQACVPARRDSCVTASPIHDEKLAMRIVCGHVSRAPRP